MQRRPQHLPRGGAKHTWGAKKGRGLRYARNRLTLDCCIKGQWKLLEQL